MNTARVRAVYNSCRMTGEERKFVCNLLRTQYDLLSEVGALQSYLDECEMANNVPRSWRMEYSRLRQSDESQSHAQVFERPISAFEKTGDSEILLQWLQILSEGYPKS